MFSKEIKCVVDYINTSIPLFENKGFFVDHFADYPDGIDGVTDTLGDAYFFIQHLPTDLAGEFEIIPAVEGGNSQVIAPYQLVVGLGCVNTRKAVEAIYNALLDNPKLAIQVVSISTNSDLIYSNLYPGHNKAADGINLILFNFIAQDMLLQSRVCTLEICEDCCAAEGNKACNCE